MAELGTPGVAGEHEPRPGRAQLAGGVEQHRVEQFVGAAAFAVPAESLVARRVARVEQRRDHRPAELAREPAPRQHLLARITRDAVHRDQHRAAAAGARRHVQVVVLRGMRAHGAQQQSAARRLGVRRHDATPRRRRRSGSARYSCSFARATAARRQ